MGLLRLGLKQLLLGILTVTGELAFEDVLNEQIPGHAYTPGEYSGLY